MKSKYTLKSTTFFPKQLLFISIAFNIDKLSMFINHFTSSSSFYVLFITCSIWKMLLAIYFMHIYPYVRVWFQRLIVFLARWMFVRKNTTTTQKTCTNMPTIKTLRKEEQAKRKNWCFRFAFSRFGDFPLLKFSMQCTLFRIWR